VADFQNISRIQTLIVIYGELIVSVLRRLGSYFITLNWKMMIIDNDQDRGSQLLLND